MTCDATTTGATPRGRQTAAPPVLALACVAVGIASPAVVGMLKPPDGDPAIRIGMTAGSSQGGVARAAPGAVWLAAVTLAASAKRAIRAPHGA